MSAACDSYLQHALDGLQYQQPLAADTWTEENIYLTRRFSDTEGFVSLEITPYVREMLQCLEDPTIFELTFCAASQVAKSMYLTYSLGYLIDNYEGQAVCALPTKEACSWHVENRWKQIGLHSPALVRRGGFENKNYKVAEQRFDSMTVTWIGSKNAAQASMRSAPYLLLDEVDKMGESTAKEPGFFHLIKERCKSFPLHKILKASTPTLANMGIWQEYLNTDQRRYHVPSPHAPEQDPFELKLDMIKWDDKAKDKKTGEWDEDKVRASAYLECPYTKKKIDDDFKPWQLTRGVWIPQRPDASKRERGYQISSIYSPWISFGDVAAKFIKAKNGPLSGMHNFYNSWLGLPFEKKRRTTTADDIDKLVQASPRYAKRTLASELRRPDYLSMTVDVQQSMFWWVVRAFYVDEDASALVDYGMAFSYDDLEDMLQNRTYSWKEERIPINVGMIDAGFEAKKTQGVYAFCARPNVHNIITPAIGRTSRSGAHSPISQKDVTFKDTELDLTTFDDDIWKSQLYLEVVPRKASHSWYLPRNLDHIYRSQISDEKLVEVPDDDGVKHEWHDSNNNHIGDCEKMQLILQARFLQVLSKSSNG